jgi:hypothetical protein
MESTLDPRTDYVFKRIFGDEDRRPWTSLESDRPWRSS